MSKIQQDLLEMKTKLKNYLDNGQQMKIPDVRPQPLISCKPDRTKFKQLKKSTNCPSCFLAVDCSTRTLKRAHNWGVYVMRVAYAAVEGRKVNWGYEERLVSAVGDRRYRSNFLIDRRLQLESEMALRILREESTLVNDPDETLREIGEGDYILLDGASFFGGKRGFHTALYEETVRKNVNLLAVSKQSPVLCDDKGRDFVASASILAPFALWIYHPVKEANMAQHLYGDVSLVKLCADSPRVFRCDIMMGSSGVLSVPELISPLTALSEDPRCLGYPITLWLAHDFSGVSNAKLLHYYDLIERVLSDEELLEPLRREELSCSFADEIHGIKRPYESEYFELY